MTRTSPTSTLVSGAILDPGDAVFFGGHVLHRSHENRSVTRMRRAFVG